jgi:AraC-like DNA-binding protein
VVVSNNLAYHVVVNALEARSDWTPLARFASTVTHVVNGHLPYHRYHAAGRARQQEGTGEGVIERMVRDWLATDLTPAVQIVRSLNQSTKVTRVFNAYNASAGLAVRTTVASLGPHSADDSQSVIKRDLLAIAEDPAPCRIGTFMMLDSMISTIQHNEREHLAPKILSLVDIACYLGVADSPAGEVALVFEREGNIPVADVARKLGCHQRTLERRLREEGITAESLRMATRLIRATSRLRSTDSLTTIALDEGFSDQAHMSRAFRASCGMSPSLLRSVA